MEKRGVLGHLSFPFLCHLQTPSGLYAVSGLPAAHPTLLAWRFCCSLHPGVRPPQPGQLGSTGTEKTLKGFVILAFT